MQSGDDFRETVRAQTDLVALVGESVALKPIRGGREHVGLCPFHDDRNPSLRVSRERQRYKCWSCGAGGDCFSFVMEREGFGFREALELLAERAGLEVPRQRGNSRRSPDGPSKGDVYKACEWVERTLHRTLKSPEGERARRYLAERGFADELVELFRIGFHPGGWQWLQERARDLFDHQTLIHAGLIKENSRGGYNDDASFRQRVTFPIRDDRGRTIAFGGRILPEDAAEAERRGHRVGKYINGSDSPLFQKSQVLYAMDVAKDAIRTSGTAVVVEGYTDCVKAHQHGLRNVVAVLGTALTEHHVALLKRFARKVVLVLDGDAAGLGAAERSLAQFLAKEVDLRVLALPAGADPDDFLSEHGADAFHELIVAAPEAWEYKLRSSVERVRERGDSLDARHEALDEMLDLLSQAEGLQGTPRGDLALAKLSQRLMIDERVVRRRLAEGRELRRRRNQGDSETNSPEQGSRVDFFDGTPTGAERMECELLEIVFAEPRWFPAIRAEVGPEDFENAYAEAIFRTCCDLHEQGIVPSYDRVTAAVEDLELKRLAALLDDWSHEKGVSAKLRVDGVTPGEQDDEHGFNEHGGTEARVNRPRFLNLAVDNLRWRRQERNHELSKGRMARRPDRPNALDDDVRALLEGAVRFHGQRVRRKPKQ